MIGPILLTVLVMKVICLMPERDAREFLIGALFPDISYLEVVVPNKKAMRNVSWQDIKNEKNDFIAGMKFHAFVSRQREQYLKDKKLYDIAPKSMFTIYALHLNDDLIFHSYLNDIDKVSAYLNEMVEAERALKIKEVYINTWHKALKNYLKDPSTKEKRFKFFKRCGKKRFRLSKNGFLYDTKKSMLMGVYQSLFNGVENVLLQLQVNNQIKGLMVEFYNDFNNYLV